MPRLLGVDIPNNKKLPYALRYIYGIGPARADQICETLGLDVDRRSNSLDESEMQRIVDIIVANGWRCEGELRREVTQNLKRMQAIQCYRGLRHRRGLPVRGQRTKTNARTRKGKRKTVGIQKAAGK